MGSTCLIPLHEETTTTAMNSKLLFTLLTLLMAGACFAQDDGDLNQSVDINVPEVALLDLESSSGTSITLSVEAPEEAGQPVDFSNAVDSSIWINYSSIRGSSTESNRHIYARIISGSVPDGMRLRVRASQDVGEGDGYMGVRTTWKTLNNNDQRVIRNIRSCYTGNGPGKGHNLTYELSLRTGNNKYRLIDFDDATTLTILYTISND